MRISAGVHSWLATQSAVTGIPIARVTELILAEAKRRGWTVMVGTSEQVEVPE